MLKDTFLDNLGRLDLSGLRGSGIGPRDCGDPRNLCANALRA